MNKNTRFKGNLEGAIMPSLISLALITSYLIFKPSLLFQPSVFLFLGMLLLWGMIEVFVMKGGGRLKFDRIDGLLQTGGLIGLMLSVIFADLNGKFIALFTFVGFFLLILGIIFRYLAIKTLGIYFSYALKVEKGSQALVDYGVYKHVRHPGYLGILLILLSLPSIHASPIGFFTTAIFSWLYINKRIAYEEKLMVDALGGSYTAYRRKTKKLIPLIY